MTHFLSRFTMLLAMLATLTAGLGLRGGWSRPAYACSIAVVPTVEELVLKHPVILVGEVTERGPQSATIKPEAFLKGPVFGGNVTLESNHQVSGASCDAEFQKGDRLLVFLDSSPSSAWPMLTDAFVLQGGMALGFNPEPISEQDLIDDVRHLTTQYAVPPAESEDPAGIDWGKTVLPVTAAVLVVFAISLVLMKQWHRIDPS